jgi:hypothetical protein
VARAARRVEVVQAACRAVASEDPPSFRREHIPPTPSGARDRDLGDHEVTEASGNRRGVAMATAHANTPSLESAAIRGARGSMSREFEEDGR